MHGTWKAPFGPSADAIGAAVISPALNLNASALIHVTMVTHRLLVTTPDSLTLKMDDGILDDRPTMGMPPTLNMDLT
jgi:hypothetical protein